MRAVTEDKVARWRERSKFLVRAFRMGATAASSDWMSAPKMTFWKGGAEVVQAALEFFHANNEARDVAIVGEVIERGPDLAAGSLSRAFADLMLEVQKQTAAIDNRSARALP